MRTSIYLFLLTVIPLSANKLVAEMIPLEPISVDRTEGGDAICFLLDPTTGEREFWFGAAVEVTTKTWTIDFGKAVDLTGFTNDVMPGLQHEQLSFYSDLSEEPISVIELTETSGFQVHTEFEPIRARFAVWTADAIYERFEMRDSLIERFTSIAKEDELTFFTAPEPGGWFVALLGCMGVVSIARARN